ncbi:MAG TPA: HDOD domain-containing protein [Polyangiaceae bacterium]
MDPDRRPTRLLFVDDEAAVLDGIRNALRRERKRWHMAFAVGPEAALTELASTEFDVVVSDMRMPGMDGAALLERVRDLQPTALRFVLSGYADRADVTRANSVAHHFLSKPCEPVVLRSMLERATALHDRIHTDAVRTVIDRLPALPPTPEPIWPMRGSDMDPLTGPVAGVLAREPRTADRFLRMANTIFGMKSSFSGAGRAMGQLGGDVAGALVVSAQASAGFQALGVSEDLIERVQNHSLLTAWLASSMLDDPDDTRTAFTAGLLHDVGTLLVQLAYRTLDGTAAASPEAALDGDEESEEARLGATHAEFGAYLLGRWGLPLAVVETVAHHHHPPAFAGSFTVPWALHLAHSLIEEASGGKPDVLAALSAESTDASFVTDLERKMSQARRQLMGHGEGGATVLGR